MATKSSVLVDVRTPALTQAPLGVIGRYAGVVLEVGDLHRAATFYRDTLGLAVQREADDEVSLLAGDDVVTLVRRGEPRVLPDSGAHFAFGVSAPDVDIILHRLQDAGVTVHTYHEDRPEERAENRYFADPDGNRLQLVQAAGVGIEHAAIEVHDVEWAEVYYTQVLGGRVTFRRGWHMDDFAQAYAWAKGEEACAPGTRRWDKRYTSVEGQARVPRPNAHFFVELAPSLTLGVYLATEHRQEPPIDQYVGTPRIVFRAGPGGLAAVEQRLQEYRVRPLQTRRRRDAAGPYERLGDSLFLRDTSGNFLEVKA